MTPEGTTGAEGASEAWIAQAKMMDEVSEARPLAKMQMELELEEGVEEAVKDDISMASGVKGLSSVENKDAPAEEVAEEQDGEGAQATALAPDQQEKVTSEKTTTPPGSPRTPPTESPAKPRKPLLNAKDDELIRVANASCLTFEVRPSR